MNYTKISRELLKTLNFRVFEKSDYFGFAGVSSPVPLIAENDAEGICVIIDGDYAELYAYDGCANFEMIDSVNNIRELPAKSAIQIKIDNLKRELAELERIANEVNEIEMLG